MKKFVKKVLLTIIHFSFDLGQFSLTLCRIMLMKFFRTKLPYKHNGRINLIVNGPSASNIMPLLGKKDEFISNPSIVVNFFANNPEYEILRPEYYCLADPMFFMDIPGRIDKVRKFFCNLEMKTTWPLVLLIPKCYGIDKFKLYSKIKNSNIEIIEVSTLGYEGFEKFRYRFYKLGFCAPRPYTVAIMALYSCINLGFNEIDIYGLDNNYYASLCLNQQGVVCDKIQHNGAPDEYREIRTDTGERISLYDYLLGLTYHLKNHEYTQQYAKYIGTKIFNHSPITMVDAYERKIDNIF